MAGSAYESINKIIDSGLDLLEHNLNESRKYLLQNDMFEKYVQQFSAGIAQLMNNLMTPPIAVFDTTGKPHFIVPGERWKLFMRANFFYSDNGNEGVSELKCTNPVTLKVDVFSISKKDAIKALQNYESLYDHSIEIVMQINDIMLGVQAKSSNSEKLNDLFAILKLVRDTYKDQRDCVSAMINGS